MRGLYETSFRATTTSEKMAKVQCMSDVDNDSNDDGDKHLVGEHLDKILQDDLSDAVESGPDIDLNEP